MHIQPTTPFIDDFPRFFSCAEKHFTPRHQRLKTGRGCLLLTSLISMLLGQYRVVRPDTWVHLWKQALSPYIYPRPLSASLLSSSLAGFHTRFHPGWRACGRMLSLGWGKT